VLWHTHGAVFRSVSLRGTFLRFGAFGLDLKRRSRNLGTARLDRDLHPHTRQRAAYHSAREVQKLDHTTRSVSLPTHNSLPRTVSFGGTHRLRPPQRLLRALDPRPSIHTHPAQGMKPGIRQHEHAPVVRFEVVDLFPEDEGPEVFADEFDRVQGGGGAGFVEGESVEVGGSLVSPCLPACPLREVVRTYRSTSPCPTR